MQSGAKRRLRSEGEAVRCEEEAEERRGRSQGVGGSQRLGFQARLGPGELRLWAGSLMVS